MATINQQIISDIAELYKVLDEHLTLDKGNCAKIDSMYKTLVTGNGDPSLPEIVRKHGAWIQGQVDSDKLKDSRAFDYRKGIVLLVLGQVITAGFAIWSGLNK
jgi:hypothetical protein